MTAPELVDDSVSAADAIGWLQDEGLARLASLGASSSRPAVAYTIDVATGIVTCYPAAGGGMGADSTTMSADDLPAPAEGPRRLVVVGITTGEQLLVVDLAGSLVIGVNGDDPDPAVRAWTVQLLLNAEVSVTTNAPRVVIGDSPRCRQSFIPGGRGPIVSIDDGIPPVTTISMNSEVDSTDYLELTGDGGGVMYLGARVWPLRLALTIADAPWAVLTETLAADT